jgi:ferritin
VKLDKIDKPPSGWKNPLAAFTDAYSHEQKVTAMINDLVELSEKERDHATRSMLQWFVDEQVEEEANADEIVQKMKMVKNAPGGIFMLDRELGSRAFVDETAEGKD